MRQFLHIRTPFIESTALSRWTGKSVWLKMEALQPSASFKIRGIGFLCQQAVQKGINKFVSSSGGNAGLAAAYAGRKLGVPVTVIVPKTTIPEMIRKIEAEGATVKIVGDVWDDAHAHAIELTQNNPKTLLVHPFNHPLLWEGHATLVDELVEDGEKPDVIILSVGGGGLMCGVLEGLYRVGWEDIPIVACETEGTASFAASVKAGKRVELEKITSVATSLGAKKISEKTFEWSQKHKIFSYVCSDASAIQACVRFADDQRLLIEPACGAALSTIYEKSKLLNRFQKMAVIVCGGTGVSIDKMAQWRQGKF